MKSNIDILNDLVAIRTDATTNKEYVDYICKILDKYNMQYIRIKNDSNNLESLIFGINCNLKNLSRAIILSGHIDTVTTNESLWKTYPYSLTIENDKCYGLGVCDMKNFTANILANLEKLKNLSKKPLIVCLSSDEETVMEGINKIIDKLKELNIKPEFTLIGEPSNDSPSNCNKGFFEFETQVIGKACHSSTPQNGINSIIIMAKIIDKINSVTKTLSEDTTLNIGVIKGGNLCNVVPDKCTLRFEMRTFKQKEVNSVTKILKEYFILLEKEFLGCKITNNLVFQIPVFEKQTNCYTKAIEKYLGKKSTIYNAATEAGFYQSLGSYALIYGVGNIKFAHSIDEEIELKHFNDYQNELFSIIKLLNN